MTNVKRSGRYHNIPSNNGNNDGSSSRSHLVDVAQLYKDINGKPLGDWSKPLFGNRHTSLQKLLDNANRATERANKFLNKIKSRQTAYANRAKSIPEIATIRKEYIKCGKQICELKHGPYYYAYWKDPETKKLKKKYIGGHMPKNEESSNSCDVDEIY